MSDTTATAPVVLPSWASWDQAEAALGSPLDTLERLVWQVRAFVDQYLEGPLVAGQDATFEQIGQLHVAGDYMRMDGERLVEWADEIAAMLHSVDNVRLSLVHLKGTDVDA